MKVFNLKTGLFIPAVLASSGALSGVGEREWHGTEQAFAPSPQEKAQARTALSGVDAAYASANATEARAKFEEATSSWNEVSSAISAREAREPKLLLNSLDAKLKSGAPAAEVNSTIYVILEELKRRHRGGTKVGAPSGWHSSGSVSNDGAKPGRPAFAVHANRSGDTRRPFGLAFFDDKARGSAER
jgi:hypothetical protein